MEKAFKGRSAAPFLGIARMMAYTHHEKWDGSGYPEGRSEADIPIPGRLMAIADVYDALITKRVYKPAFHHSEAEEIIAQAKGKLFDPDIVDVFLRVREEFRKIALKYADFDEERRLLSKSSFPRFLLSLLENISRFCYPRGDLQGEFHEA
jgi:response regulator RpfG family c-di-GMP phosphodiesterase